MSDEESVESREKGGGVGAAQQASFYWRSPHREGFIAPVAFTLPGHDNLWYKVRRFSAFNLSIFFRIKTMVTHNNRTKNQTLSGCVYEAWDLFSLCCTHHLPILLANLMRTWKRASLEQCMEHGFWPSADHTFTLTHFSAMCYVWADDLFRLKLLHPPRKIPGCWVKEAILMLTFNRHPLGRCGFHCLQIRDTGAVATAYERRQENHHELESGF